MLRNQRVVKEFTRIELEKEDVFVEGYSFNQSDAISAHHCHCKDCQKINKRYNNPFSAIQSLKIEGDLKFFTVSVQQDLASQEGSVKNVVYNWFPS